MCVCVCVCFRLQKPLLQKKELFPLLEPVFYWLANTLEFYNFLELHQTSLGNSSTCSRRDNEKSSSNLGKEEDEEKPMETLYSILVYVYQQAFYPISKVRWTGQRRGKETVEW